MCYVYSRNLMPLSNQSAYAISPLFVRFEYLPRVSMSFRTDYYLGRKLPRVIGCISIKYKGHRILSSRLRNIARKVFGNPFLPDNAFHLSESRLERILASRFSAGRCTLYHASSKCKLWMTRAMRTRVNSARDLHVRGCRNLRKKRESRANGLDKIHDYFRWFALRLLVIVIDGCSPLLRPWPAVVHRVQRALIVEEDGGEFIGEWCGVVMRA